MPTSPASQLVSPARLLADEAGPVASDHHGRLGGAACVAGAAPASRDRRAGAVMVALALLASLASGLGGLICAAAAGYRAEQDDERMMWDLLAAVVLLLAALGLAYWGGR